MSLHCILQYTASYAKGMTKNCMHLPAEIGFETTKWLHTERNGDPYRIIAILFIWYHDLIIHEIHVLLGHGTK